MINHPTPVLLATDLARKHQYRLQYFETEAEARTEALFVQVFHGTRALPVRDTTCEIRDVWAVWYETWPDGHCPSCESFYGITCEEIEADNKTDHQLHHWNYMQGA